MDKEIIEIVILLIVFQFKHFIVDYIIQIADPEHTRKFDIFGWFSPLLKHASHHGLGSLAITALYLSYSNIGFTSIAFIFLIIGVLVFDTAVHFTVDRIKASPNFLGKYCYPTKEYFRSVGLDQMMHHFTHYIIIFTVMYVVHYWG